MCVWVVCGVRGCVCEGVVCGCGVVWVCVCVCGVRMEQRCLDNRGSTVNT